MKKIIFLLLPVWVAAQAPDPCDSLFIQCCTINADNSSLLHLEASNHATDIFDYPGFVLFNANQDTIAKEIVNYFGIGWGYQPHDMVLYQPFTLPFEGELRLYTLFYDSLACTIPISLADTVLSSENEATGINTGFYPNPVNETLFVTLESAMTGFTISDISGKSFHLPFQKQETALVLNVQSLPSGIYILSLINNNKIIKTMKFIKPE